MFALVDNVLGHVSSLLLLAAPLALLQARVDLHQHLQHIALRSLASLRQEGRCGGWRPGKRWSYSYVCVCGAPLFRRMPTEYAFAAGITHLVKLRGKFLAIDAFHWRVAQHCQALSAPAFHLQYRVPIFNIAVFV